MFKVNSFKAFGHISSCMSSLCVQHMPHTSSHLCRSSLRSSAVPESNWGTSPHSACSLDVFVLFTRPLHMQQSNISLLSSFCRLLCFLAQVEISPLLHRRPPIQNVLLSVACMSTPLTLLSTATNAHSSDLPC